MYSSEFVVVFRYDPAGLSAEPFDEDGHGTHTMGTMLGSKGIGVAPGAKWMACKGCGIGKEDCPDADLLACGQWLLCPTLTDGTSGRACSQAPQIASNSWGEYPGFRPVVNAWQAGGIIPIFSIGNDGELGCITTSSPGDFDNVIGVGATTINNTLVYFSSRGPVLSPEGLLRVKPDVSAPGLDVYSAWFTNDTAYETLSGTSMAAPHVTGVVALMLDAKPTLTYLQVKRHLLNGSTRDLEFPSPRCEQCETFPNNEFGNGLVNAKNSVRLTLIS